jgi:mannosyltransferase
MHGREQGLALTSGQVGRRTWSARRWLAWIAIIAITLAVFAMYMGTLTLQSLVFEEGLSVIFCSRPLPELMHTLIYEDLHPPLHYLLLHFWMLAAGSSERAVRMPSVLAAILLVPLSLAVVREVWGQEGERTLHGTGLGIAAAGLAASSPFVAYYAQETRMYSLVAALALATTWSFLRATRSHDAPQRFLLRARRWGAFSCLLAASLYTQYFSLFLVPAFLLYGLLLDRRSWRPMVLSMLATALLYVPWLRPAYLQMRRLLYAPDYWVTTRIDVWSFLRMIWNAFVPSVPKQLAVLGAALASILLMRLARQTELRLSQRRKRTLLILLTSLIPLVLTYVVVSLMPKFVARYTIVAAAPLYICLVLVLYSVLGQASKWSRALFYVLVAAAIIISLRSATAVVEGRENSRADIRSVSAYLSQHAQPNDAFLMMENAPYAFQYYYHGDTPLYGLHVGIDFPHGANVLNEILSTKPRRLWLILWHHEFADPTDMLVTELLRVGREVLVEEQFLGHQLRAFDIDDYDHPVVAFPQPQKILDAFFAPGLQLLGVDRFRDAGGQLHYVCYWQATKLLQHNYSLTLSLQDAEGNEYLRKHQALSTDYFLPPAWPVNTPLRGRVDLILPKDLPALPYQVYVSVFDPDSQGDVDLIDAGGSPVGRALLVEEIFLPKSAMSKAMTEVTNPLQVDLRSGLDVLGFALDRGAYHQGDLLALTLWWRRTDMPLEAMAVQFRMMDSSGQVAWQDERPVLAGYSPSQWQEGETNRAVYRLAVPSDLASDEYQLQVGLAGQWATLSELGIEARVHLYDRPAIQYALDLTFEPDDVSISVRQDIVLLGHDLSTAVVRPGGTVKVTLYWQTQEPIATSYKVSVQVLSPDMQLVAQDDSIPVSWTYPTTAWLPGEIVIDEHVLTVAPEAPPGSYTLIALIYDPKNSGRLNVEQAGRVEDHATLNVLEIAP